MLYLRKCTDDTIDWVLENLVSVNMYLSKKDRVRKLLLAICFSVSSFGIHPW